MRIATFMMLFAAHNSGPLSPNFCINTRCRGFHRDILSRRFPKPAGLPLARSVFSANATPPGSLALHQPCHPKHFSLTLNTAFHWPYSFPRNFFFFLVLISFVLHLNCHVRSEENTILLEETDLNRI